MTMLTSILGGDKLQFILDCCTKTQDVPGDMAELGVYHGGTALRMSMEQPTKTIHLFDTFTGIPAKADDIDVHGVGDFRDVDLERIKAGFEGRRAKFHVGVFPATTQGLEETAYCLVHIDGDQYQTTKDGLSYFYPRMSPGGIMIFDDYKWQNCPGVEKAMTEFFSDKLERVMVSCWSQAYVTKDAP